MKADISENRPISSQKDKQTRHNIIRSMTLKFIDQALMSHEIENDKKYVMNETIQVK